MADKDKGGDDDDLDLAAEIGKAVNAGDVTKVNELTKEAKKRGLY